MLTAEQQAARENRVTASFLPSLMAGMGDEILREWMRLTGHPDYVVKDLSHSWPVHLGEILETPMLDWHAKETGQPITRRGEVVVHPSRPWFSCTLDGWRAVDNCVIDAKSCGRWQTLDEIESFYTPQILAQMGCVQAERGALLVVHGGAEPIELEIFDDPEYLMTMWKRVDQFWGCVQTLTPPWPLPHIVPPERWRKIDLDINRDYNWAAEMIDNLFLWATMEDHAKQFEGAKERVKELLPPDVGLVTVAGLAVKRFRNNAVSIRHIKVVT